MLKTDHRSRAARPDREQASLLVPATSERSINRRHVYPQQRDLSIAGMSIQSRQRPHVLAVDKSVLLWCLVRFSRGVRLRTQANLSEIFQKVINLNERFIIYTAVCLYTYEVFPNIAGEVVVIRRIGYQIDEF